MSDASRNSSPSDSKDLNGEASCPDDSSMSAQELNHSQSSDGENASDTEYDPEILAAIEASREDAEKEHVDPQIAAAIAASMKEAEHSEDNHVNNNETDENIENKESVGKESENLDETSQITNDQRDTSEKTVENTELKDNDIDNLLESTLEEEKEDEEENRENDADHIDDAVDNEETELKQEGEIELDGEPEIAENPFEEDAEEEDAEEEDAEEEEEDASNPLEGDDDYDPLNNDYDPLDNETEENEEDKSGNLDDKSNGTSKKKRANPVYITPIKKARKRSYSNSSDEDDIPEGDSDFTPGTKKSRSTPRRSRTTRPKRSPKKVEVLFKCTICTFNSEILGELNIHKHSSHKNQSKPSYLDMAEVVIAKLDDKSGSNKTNIFKQMMSDHAPVIPEEKNKASQILSRALSGGVQLGRLRETKKGGKGAANYWIVNKDKRKLILEKWRKNKRSVEHKDTMGVVEGSKEFMEIKEKLTKYNIQVTTAPKSTTPPPDTKNYGRGKRESRPPPRGSVITHNDNSDEDEIAIIEEKITPKTKMRLMHKKKMMAKEGGAKTVIRVNSAQGKQLLRKIVSTGAVPKSASAVTKPTIKKDADDSDDDSQLTCSICLSSFWYANQTFEHMKKAHSIENPEKFIKDRLKK
eukprot:GFUD01011192.1.p1 GENE.GFUD01011192.1~~GFUD01011192.1.p1  ORF type:complete len:641 (+),score=221.43 GFUD01011192.1:47-1969(+)